MTASARRNAQSLRERFPAVLRLEWPLRARIPHVPQMTVSDCGPACLTMVLRTLGSDVRADTVRDRVGTGRDGSSAADLVDAAQSFGLRARAIHVEPEDLRLLSAATILHWQMSHFVVLESVGRSEITVVDPATGRRRVPMPEVRKSLTGIALEFERTASFEKAGRRRARRYVRQILARSGLLRRILALSVLGQAVGLALPLLTGAVIDRVIPHADLGLLHVVIAGLAALAVFTFLTSYLRGLLFLQLRTELDVGLTLDFFEHLLRLPFGFFQSRQTGDLMMRLNSNATIRDILTSSAMSAVLDGFLVCSYLIVLLFTNATFGAVVVGLGALRVAIFVLTRTRTKELTHLSLQAQSASSNLQLQILTGIETLKSAGAEPRALQSWSNAFVDVTNIALQSGKLTALVGSILGFVGTASTVLLLAYSTSLVLADRMSLGTMMAMNALAAGFLGPLSNLVSTALALETLDGYVERVEDVLDREPEQAGDLEPAPQLVGRIELRNVAFRYAETSPLVLQGISLTVPEGATVAIVGASGSGKSTLARILVGLLPPTSGEVLYDGQDPRRWDARTLRRQFGFVAQNSFLFAESLRNNIALSRFDMPLESIEHSAHLAAIHDDIAAMPLGYDTQVSAGGTSLSGGQRQRVALARALAARPTILVLDEATSHLDSVTEGVIRDNIEKLRCTRLIIAHRLATIQNADHIYVMAKGRIVESGRHDDLLARRGAYAALFDGQMEGERHSEFDS